MRRFVFLQAMRTHCTGPVGCVRTTTAHLSTLFPEHGPIWACQVLNGYICSSSSFPVWDIRAKHRTDRPRILWQKQRRWFLGSVASPHAPGRSPHDPGSQEELWNPCFLWQGAPTKRTSRSCSANAAPRLAGRQPLLAPLVRGLSCASRAKAPPPIRGGAGCGSRARRRPGGRPARPGSTWSSVFLFSFFLNHAWQECVSVCFFFVARHCV